MINKLPSNHCSILLSLQEYLQPSPIIVIRGPADELKNWQEKYDPIENIVFAIPDDETNLPEGLAAKKAIGKTCAYVCRGMQCEVSHSSRVD